MQTKTQSLIEAIIGTAVGFILSWALLSFVIVPIFNLQTNTGEDFLITTMFTVLSVLRSFWVRRFFNWWHNRPREEFPPVVSFLGGKRVEPPADLPLREQLAWIEDYENRVIQAAQNLK